jgi:regulator of protease activity HflC (stomatin/prohibitin superfamily)
MFIVEILLNNIVYIVIILLLFFSFRKGVVVVPQQKSFLIERFGKYRRTLNSGLNFIIPFLDRIRDRTGIDLREIQLPETKMELITKDNVEIEAVVNIFYRITNPEKSEYRVDNLKGFIETSIKSIVRDVAGNQQLDEIQRNRKTINDAIKDHLAETSEEWGVAFTRTEITDIDIDEKTKEAQRAELAAERTRRAEVIKAEGEKKVIELQAEADLIKKKKEAEGKKVTADADAYAIKKQGEAIQNNGQAAVSFEILKKQVEAISEVARSQNSKTIILPTDVTKVLGSFETVLESIKQK